MRFTALPSIVLCAAMALAAPAVAQLQIPVDELNMTLTITEAVEAHPVPVEWAGDEGVWQGASADGISISLERRETAGDLQRFDCAVRNDDQERRLLEFTASVASELEDESALYWNGGWSAVRPIPGPQETDEPRPRGAWPLSAAGDAGSAIVLGITPDTLISYAEPSFEHAPGGASVHRFHVRMVVDPGREEAFSLVAGTADARWGFLRGAWQAYHDSFPEYARVSEGAPEAIWGTSAQYHAWWAGIDREELRRLRCTWDWCYAPFKRSGDFWGREDEWEYEPLGTPFSERLRGMLGGSYNMGEISAEQFREEREAFFAEYGYDTGSLFYTPSGIWVEEQLAEQKFADSLVENESMKTELSQWVTGYDDELLVQPTGTSYDERLKEDYRLTAENLDIIGFAFDVCVAGQRNYSEAVQQPLAGRSWDERGVFFDLGISMVEQMRHIRGLDWGDAPFKRGLIVGSGTSFTAWHVDGALLELTLTGQRRDSWEAMNMALGGKPGVIWKGYELREVLQDPDGMPRADFLNVWAKMADYVTLKSFQWGMFPGYNYLPGMDKLQRDFPLLQECIRTGWQPVCPVDVEGDAELWMGRYGSGADVMLAVGNPHDDSVATELTVHNDIFSDGDCVFVDAKNQAEPLSQTVDGRATRLEIEAPMRRVSVLRSVLGVQCDQPLECAASVEEDLDRVVVRVTLTAPEATESRLAVPERRGYEVAGMTLNGEPWERRGTLPAGQSVFEATYVSRHFDFDQAALDEFAFLTDEGETAFVVVSPEPGERAQNRIIERFDRYFGYYAEHELGREEIQPVLVATEPRPAGPQIVLNIGADATGNGWSLSGETLTLNAPDEEQAVLRTEELLAAMDRRFEHTVPFLPVYGMASRHLQARELFGLTMTEALAQEGQTW